MRHLDFGLSYAKNGELLKYIRKIGSFDETCTRFYTAELVSALEYLHGKGIIHRYFSAPAGAHTQAQVQASRPLQLLRQLPFSGAFIPLPVSHDFLILSN